MLRFLELLILGGIFKALRMRLLKKSILNTLEPNMLSGVRMVLTH